MLLRDQPEKNPLHLPPDNLSLQERLSRLFSGIDNRWRLLAVLTLKSGPSNLLKGELTHLAEEYGPMGLAVRLIFIGDKDIETLERELSHWTDEHIVATGDSIHARRFLIPDQDYLPCLKLYAPDGMEEITISGFDTEKGLDALCHKLGEVTEKDCKVMHGEKNTEKLLSVHADRNL